MWHRVMLLWQKPPPPQGFVVTILTCVSCQICHCAVEQVISLQSKHKPYFQYQLLRWAEIASAIHVNSMLCCNRSADAVPDYCNSPYLVSSCMCLSVFEVITEHLLQQLLNI